MNALQPQRTIEELKELRRLTGDENGAQRVAFTPTWAKARDWLHAKAESLGAEVERDEAGNLWMTLRGASDKALLLGGHIDSVPNGGWLDGCLNTLAGLEVLRNLHAQFGGRPPVTDSSGRLGRRGRRTLRQKPLRFVGVLGQSRHG